MRTRITSTVTCAIVVLLPCLAGPIKASNCLSDTQPRCRRDSVDYRFDIDGKLEPLRVTVSISGLSLPYSIMTSQTTTKPEKRDFLVTTFFEFAAASTAPPTEWDTWDQYEQRNRPIDRRDSFGDLAQQDSPSTVLYLPPPFMQRNRPHSVAKRHMKIYRNDTSDFCCAYPEDECVGYKGPREDLVMCYNPSKHTFYLENDIRGSLLTHDIQYSNGSRGRIEDLGLDFFAPAFKALQTFTGVSSITSMLTMSQSTTLQVMNHTRATMRPSTTTPVRNTDIVEQQSGAFSRNYAAKKGARKLMTIIAAGWLGFAAFCSGITSGTHSCLKRRRTAEDDAASDQIELCDEYEGKGDKNFSRDSFVTAHQLTQLNNTTSFSLAHPYNEEEEEEAEEESIPDEYYAKHMESVCHVCGWLMPERDVELAELVDFEEELDMEDGQIEYMIMEGWEGYVRDGKRLGACDSCHS